MQSWEKALVGPDTSLRDALVAIDGAGAQIALVVDAKRRLLGTLSDGDIRRALIRGIELRAPVTQAMRNTPVTASASDSKDAVLTLMRRIGLHQVPLLDDQRRVVGLQRVDDFFVTTPRDNWVVVMAGGLGTRLKELTENTPKPMLRVGDRPLLETILRNYIDQGFSRFYLAVNYKAEVIEAHFGDGAALGAEIRYLRETKRMGTAGALSLLPEPITVPLFVTNGDLLVKADFGDMLEDHQRSKAVATMAVREYEFQIPYGVVKHEGGAIERIEEKPVQRSLVSAGMYVLAPEALEIVPRDTFFDMPTLFDEIIGRGRPARCYTVHGYWMDIGRMTDYQKANDDFPEVFR